MGWVPVALDRGAWTVADWTVTMAWTMTVGLAMMTMTMTVGARGVDP